MAKQVDRRCSIRCCLSALLTATLVLTAPLSVAEYQDVPDIKAFGLLRTSGHFRVGYLFDDRQRNSDQSESFESRSTWEEDVFLLTESFIYHPGFLNMDLGGGPMLVQQTFDSTSGKTSYDDTLVNLLARLNFLELKNYPFSLYYQRSHPSVTTSLAGRFITESDTHGVRGRVFNIFGGSSAVRFEAESRTTEGGALGAVVDEEYDSALIQLETSYRDYDRLQVKYDRFDSASASGSPGLPIFPSTTSQQNSEIRSENLFGASGQLKILQVLRRLQQDTKSTNVTSLDNRHYLADVRWKHTDRMRSFFRYRLYDTKRTFSDSESQDVELGFVRQANDNFNYDVAAEFESAEQTGFSRDQSELRGSFNVSRKLGFGSLGLSGSLRGARTDQESSAAGIPVFDEPHVLNGTAPVDLANEFVITESVVVSNSQRTQIFVEGLDYRLLVIGSVTSVQRLISGNINDGETVVVDYSYETSGTVEFDTLGSGLSINIGFLDTMNAYLRYDSQDTSLRNGVFTNPINDRTGLEVGISASNQFLDGWSLSGQFRHRDQNEEISPFVSDALDISLTTSLRGTWQLTLSGSLSKVDFENSNENVNQTSYRLVLSGRPFRGAQLTYDAAYFIDDGGSLLRDQLGHRLNFQWTYRQVRFVLRALYSEDTLGNSERDNAQITAQITRVF